MYTKLRPTQGCNARKVNCGRVYSAYTLKPEYFIDFFMWKMDPMSGFDIRLVFTLPPRDSTLQYKRCVHFWKNFPYITSLDRHISCVKSVYCSGRRSKQRIQGQRIIFEGKGPEGWNKKILLMYFPYWPESQKSYVFALPSFWTVISHQSFSTFHSTSVGALGLFTFRPQCTVHNMHIFELGVPVYSSFLCT